MNNRINAPNEPMKVHLSVIQKLFIAYSLLFALFWMRQYHRFDLAADSIFFIVTSAIQVIFSVYVVYHSNKAKQKQTNKEWCYGCIFLGLLAIFNQIFFV